jgi:hypothetical protein
MDGLGPVVAGFLPPPERLVLSDDKVQVTLSLFGNQVNLRRAKRAGRVWPPRYHLVV